MNTRLAKRMRVLGACILFFAACDDEESDTQPNLNPDAAFDSQDGSPVDAPVAPVADASTHLDAMVDAQTIDATVPVDAAFVEPPVEAPAGCTLTSTQHTSAEQAGLPTGGLALWLRADQGVYKDTNNAVCAWVDHSGSGHVLKSQGLAMSPTYVAASGAVLPNIRFMGGGKALSVTGALGIAAQSGRTFIAVQKLVNVSGRSQPIIQGQGGTPGTYVSIDTNPFQTKGNLEGAYITNNAYDSSLATSTDWRVHDFLIGPMVIASPILPAITYRINGTPLTLTRTPGGLGNTNFENFSGANFTAVGAGVAGSDFTLAEILVYDHTLSAQDVAKVEAALTQRYGINAQGK